jgi:hypothetical protein
MTSRRIEILGQTYPMRPTRQRCATKRRNPLVALPADFSTATLCLPYVLGDMAVMQVRRGVAAFDSAVRMDAQGCSCLLGQLDLLHSNLREWDGLQCLDIDLA